MTADRPATDKEGTAMATVALPTTQEMQSEAKRSCSGCGKPVIHANEAPQRGFGSLSHPGYGREPEDYVCIDNRVGFLHEGECCRCWDAHR